MALPDDNYRLALHHHQAGRLAEAEDAYRQVLSANPQHAGALHGMGALAIAANEPQLAEQLIRRALSLRADWPEAWYHLGVALQARERFDEAIPAYRRSVALNPALFDAHYQLAVCLQLSGQRDKAIAEYRQAIALRGNDPFALTNFAIALQSGGQLDEAIAILRQATALRPDFAEAFLRLGMTLQEDGQLEQAVAAFGRATELKPQHAPAWTNLATALRDSGQIDAAIAARRKAVALEPDKAESNFELAKLLLLSGDFDAGLPMLPWRWKSKTLPWPRRRCAQPMWAGEDLAGKTIYLHAEQSLADAIQWIRYVPMVADRGPAIVVECQPALRRLFEASFGPAVRQWFSPGEKAPAFDVYCPLLDLPRWLGIPGFRPPYLQAPAWRGPAIESSTERKVGIVWAGSPSEISDRKRSMSLADFAPLRDVPGVRFYSLQKGRSAMQATEPNAPLPIVDRTGTLADFADTAALVNQLDLVISVDSAVAHLAGAMGKPVWTLLPFVPHWRWGMTGEATAWYPTMRLFRQTSAGDWGDVMRHVSEAIAAFAFAK